MPNMGDIFGCRRAFRLAAKNGAKNLAEAIKAKRSQGQLWYREAFRILIEIDKIALPDIVEALECVDHDVWRQWWALQLLRECFPRIDDRHVRRLLVLANPGPAEYEEFRLRLRRRT